MMITAFADFFIHAHSPLSSFNDNRYSRHLDPSFAYAKTKTQIIYIKVARNINMIKKVHWTKYLSETLIFCII